MRLKLPRLIGIAGAAGSGKDTVADYLVRQHGFIKRPLSAPIKALLNEFYGWLPEWWNDRVWKEAPDYAGASPRQLAQWLGTEAGRMTHGEDCWINVLLREWKHANAMTYGKACMVVPDVRFDNEASAITQHGGIVVRIDRPGVTPVAAHSSEAGIASNLIDVVVVNDSTPDLLLRNFVYQVEDFLLDNQDRF
jgi:hypothetical protein